jgi:hypothetical protein
MKASFSDLVYFVSCCGALCIALGALIGVIMFVMKLVLLAAP